MLLGINKEVLPLYCSAFYHKEGNCNINCNIKAKFYSTLIIRYTLFPIKAFSLINSIIEWISLFKNKNYTHPPPPKILGMNYCADA